MIALIAAGGWVAVLIITIVCLIGLLMGSVFGVFFSGEDSGAANGRTMSAVISVLTAEVYEEIEDIKNENAHDVLDIDSVSINWPEILSVYAVKVNTDSENPAEVVTLNDGKVDILRSIFNKMISLSHSIETQTQDRTVTDEGGNETTETVSVTMLKITLSQKNSVDMAAEYGFSEAQMEQLHELLNPKYSDMWATLIQ